jgi:hypothetical protein
MKYLMMVAIIIVVCNSLFAQEETLYSGSVENGWYAALTFNVGPIMDEIGFFIGGKGGWIINHRFVLGAKGYILLNPVDHPGLQNIHVGFGCGGLLLEYICNSDKLWHLSIENMIGVAGVYNDISESSQAHDPIDYTGESGFIMEPGINIHLNVMENFRISSGLSYRWITGLDYDPGAPYRTVIPNEYEDISGSSDLNGFMFNIAFQYGLF